MRLQEDYCQPCPSLSTPFHLEEIQRGVTLAFGFRYQPLILCHAAPEAQCKATISRSIEVPSET